MVDERQSASRLWDSSTRSSPPLQASPSVVLSAPRARPRAAAAATDHARARLAHPPLDPLDRAESIERRERRTPNGRSGRGGNGALTPTAGGGGAHPRDVAGEARPAGRPAVAPPLAEGRAERFRGRATVARGLGGAKGSRRVPHGTRVGPSLVVAASERVAAVAASTATARGSRRRVACCRVLQATVGRGSPAGNGMRLVVQLQGREGGRREEWRQGRPERVSARRRMPVSTQKLERLM